MPATFLRRVPVVCWSFHLRASILARLTQARPQPTAPGAKMARCSTLRRTCISAASKRKPKAASHKLRVAEEALYLEERVPPIDRVLGVRGVLGDRAIKHIKQNMRTALRSAKPTLPRHELKILERTIEDFLSLGQLSAP